MGSQTTLLQLVRDMWKVSYDRNSGQPQTDPGRTQRYRGSVGSMLST